MPKPKVRGLGGGRDAALYYEDILEALETLDGWHANDDGSAAAEETVDNGQTNH